YSLSPTHKKYGDRVYDCAELLKFHYIDDLSTGESKLKLKTTQFCRVRLCPVCQWRRSMAWRARLFQNLPNLFAQYSNLRFIFLTLTIKNCEIYDLSDVLTALNKAWKKLISRKEFKPIKGYIRATEVTKSGNQAHPHFHCILAVSKSYFTDKDYYISQAKWAELWQSCLSVDYLPVVDVRAIKQVGYDVDPRAIIETLKYTTKIGDLLEDKDWFLQLTDQLHKKRFLATGGVFKDVLKESVTSEEMICKNEENEQDEDLEQEKSLLYFGFDHGVKKYKKVKNPHG
ncbi:protein rep, partial [Avibacterium avium]